MDSEVRPQLRIRPFESGEDLKGLSLEIPSDLSRIKEAVELVSGQCVKMGLGHRAASFNLRVALSEAISNAILYGNKLDVKKTVNVTAEAAGEKISIRVADEGPGYDPAAVPDPTTPERIKSPDGRGLFLIRNLVDEVTFSERGNAICMVLRRS
jgi:serine/threonine-protein kinase RsbW